ncbi:carbohydrate kinase family protein [Candidatus Woesearchaeota archaeon]|nr:carbohydrate kinase family protein [Candidatus Woesearchaeota archaeon]
MFDVICVGSSTVDVFAKTKYSELIKIMDNNNKEEDLLAYPVGGKILINELDFTTGGGGTNVAVSLSKLGLKAAYLGCMGKGGNSEIVLGALKKFKVDSSLVVRKKGDTGYSIILDSIEHDRTILAYKGLNNELDFKDIKKDKLKTKWFYFSAMLNKAFKTQEKIAKFAEKNKIKIAFNPSSYLAERGSHFLKNIISRTEILVLNKEEAALIVGKDSIEYLAKKLYQLGPNYVVITDGRKGAYCYHDGFLYFAKTNNIPIVETTGAGDAFASAFLAGIILMNRKGRKNNAVEFALKLATTNAESVISYHGAKNKLLALKEAEYILSRKRQIKVSRKKLN